MIDRADVSVLIPAAGSGERLGQGPKAWVSLAGRPVIDWVADKARQLGAEVLVACAPGMWRDFIAPQRESVNLRRKASVNKASNSTKGKAARDIFTRTT